MIQLFKPYLINNNDKIRLGPDEDGGYVTSTISLDSSIALFTYGVGHDARYEESYKNKYDKEVYLYDHTIGKETGWDLGKKMNFINEGLGFKENCDDFINHYKKSGIAGDVLLKVDIEGDEYDYFEKVDIEEMAKITTGILLEMHWLTDSGYQKRAEKILTKIYEHFTLTHIHGNAWGTTWDYEGYKVPETFELSLVNNKYITSKQFDLQDYPIIGLDVSNRRDYPDLDLKFLNQI
jgi:hypothetical protein